MSADLYQGFRLRDRTVLPRQNRIAGGGTETRVEPKTMAVLVCLAENAGEVVSREFLDEHVWRDRVVTDQALTNCISELRRRLGDTREQPRFIETVPKRGYRLVAPVLPLAPPKAPRGARGKWARTIASLGLAAALAAVAWWGLQGSRDAAVQPPAAVAVAPFRQLHGAASFEYLQLALPDEITTVLSRASDLTVRPFRPDAPTDPAQAAAVADAALMIGGYYYVSGNDNLAITIQAVDVNRDRILWRTRLTMPLGDILNVRDKITGRIRDQLLPVLGVGSPSAGGRPMDAQAYRLYLHSLAIPRNPESNVHAIAMLEEATRLDPGFAPAWEELADHLRFAAQYGDGGMQALRRAQAADERALALDPHFVEAATSLILTETELGHVVDAHRNARELVAQNPRSAPAHFTLAYVLRYGGLLHDAQRHCEIALLLDPHYFAWRSCAFAFMAAGELDSAARYLALDPNSNWAALVTPALKMRQGDTQAALRAARRLPLGTPDRQFLIACLEGKRGKQLDALAPAYMQRWTQSYDAEPLYWIAGTLAFCARPRDALAMLRRAVEGHFCSYPALDRDPIWHSLRDHPGFQHLRRRAIACRDKFRAAIQPPP